MMEDLELNAHKNNIPIMERDGIEFLIDYIKKNSVKSILEIGSAIGYSAINMALISSEIKVVTIERDNARYLDALKNIKLFNLEKQIVIINDDAFNVEIKDKFDLIFIDAAKSQSTKFFEKFKINLEKKGTIITDNIYFHGLTYDMEIKSKNLRQMTRKIREYVEFLKDNKEFKTDIIEIGDGIAVSRRICE
ncbi:MAG: O-methyltransferase [Bacilli bacterium]|nr:O-methyltransferase [Bacilli bacterium]